MKFEDLRDYLKDKKVFTNIKRYKQDVYEAIMTNTSFLSDDIGFTERCKVIKHGISTYEDIPDCSVCKKNKVRFINKDLSETCSYECSRKLAQQKSEDTFLTKYGVKNPFQDDGIKSKIRKTNKDRYGNESFTKTDLYREKTKATCIGRYGEDHHLKSQETKNKIKQTNQERFGVDNVFESKEFQHRIKETNTIKYGHEHFSKSLVKPASLEILEDKDELIRLYKTYGANFIIDTLGVSKKTVYDYLNLHGVEFDYDGKSGYEKELEQFIIDLGFLTRSSVKDIINPYELDIVVPDKNLAIEFNGIFWHSSKFKDKDYHQMKSLLCKDVGIQLIHVWEDDWINNKDVVKKKIRSKLGFAERVFARCTESYLPSVSEVRELYDSNHIQGFVSATVHIGLKDDTGLVACASFRDKGNGVWDLVRYAGSKTVVGGFSKILKRFKRDYEWSEIFTYAHLDYSYGNLYEKTGFNKSHITQPGLWYTDFKKRYRREKFMKHKLSTILENFDPERTERENMLAHGFYQIFDAGSIKYTMTNT